MFRKNNNTPRSNSYIGRIAIAVAYIVVLTVLVLLLISRTPPLLDPFPNYPNGLEVNNTLSHGYYGLLDLSCGGVPFIGEKYKIFATQDNENQILTFYKKLANDKNLTEYIGSTGSSYNDQGSVLCFLGSSDNRKVPINAIILFNPSNSEQVKIISDVFPTAPSNKIIVISLQGIGFYE